MIPRPSSNSVGAIFLFIDYVHHISISSSCQRYPAFLYPFYLSFVCGLQPASQRTHKKKHHCPDRSSQFIIYKHSRKGTEENRNQHINTKLRYHDKRLVNISVIFQNMSLSKSKLTVKLYPLLVLMSSIIVKIR